MAKNAVFPYTEAQTEIWPVTATTAPGTALVSSDGRSGVAITGSGDYTVSTTVGPFTIGGIPRGGATVGDREVPVATDGTWEFPVTGATAQTTQNTPVYFADGALSLTGEEDAAAFGSVNFPKDYVFHDTVLPIKIGAFA